MYSWDEGLTWEPYKIDEKIEVTNILIEPTNLSLKFIVYGRQTFFKGISQTVVVVLDFSSLHQRECIGYEDPDSPFNEDNDYEI